MQRQILVGFMCAIFMMGTAQARGEAGDEESLLPIPEPYEARTSHNGTFGGTRVSYDAVIANSILKNDDGEVYAEVFTTSYIKKGANAERPVMFIFNGGPGSSSIWLHMGMLGPKRIVVPSDAEDTGLAPYQMAENSLTPLDLTDLVFIDPVGTGYSRLAGVGKPSDVYGLREDARTVSQVVREWVRKHNRWNAPKYIAGESFGTTRAAAMLPYLQENNEPMRINGLILISQALDYEGSTPKHGNFESYVTYIPTMAATAWYHGKIPNQPDLDAFLAEVKAFAVDEYMPALFKGSTLDEASFNRIAAKLSSYIGISEDYIKRANLRVLGGRFNKELLRDQGLSVGYFDSRYTLDEVDDTADRPRFDAADAAISAAFSSALHHYFQNDLEVGMDRPYYLSGDEVGENWVFYRRPDGYFEPDFVNTAMDLANGMAYNPAMRVYLASGYYDYSTPFFDGDFTFWRYGIDMSRVTISYFESGHMMYLHEPSFQKISAEVRQFLEAELKK